MLKGCRHTDTKDCTVINMTESAVNAVRMAIDGAKDPIAGLRVMVGHG